jgi:peptidoglycan/xylan/chitin deacetylase (PgdA/CDA1 family)
VTRVPRWLQRWRDAAVILSYHNVVPAGSARGERSLHVPVPRFREQLERLGERFRIVPLAEVLARHRAGQRLRGLAAVTFDDGYRGVVRHALPMLARWGAPATLFVIGGALGRREPFWWDRLADAAGGEIPDRERCLTELAGDESRIAATGAAPAPNGRWPEWDDYFPASADELAALDPALFSLGVHTMTHPNLARVPANRCTEELRDCWYLLRDRFTNAVPVVAYPYGAADARVVGAAEALGLAGVTLSGATLTRRDGRGVLPRLFVGPGMTADALEVRAAGLRLQ